MTTGRRGRPHPHPGDSLNLRLFVSRQSFFRKHAPSEKGPYGISPEVMDTYVKSCGELLFVPAPLPGALNQGV